MHNEGERLHVRCGDLHWGALKRDWQTAVELHLHADEVIEGRGAPAVLR